MAKITDKQIRHFDSPAQFIDYVQHTAAAEGWTDDRRASRDTQRYNFTHSTGWGEAIQLATQGWQEGLKRVTKELGMTPSTGKSKVTLHDVAGDYPIVAKAIIGVPDSMVRRVNSVGKRRPIINLLVNVGAPAMFNSTAIENRGVAIASVIDQLEDMGYSVGLSVVSYAVGMRGANGNCGVTFPVKRAGEAMSLENMMFFTSHPAFLRRLVFAYRETMVTANDITSYGSSSNIQATEDEDIYFTLDMNLNTNYRTMTDAVRNVKAIVKSYRPDLFGEVA